MVSLAKRARASVVIGGGITALEIVEGLRHHCRRIHYLLRGDRYWSNVLDEDESRLVMSRLVREGVEVHYRTEAALIQGTSGHVSAILTTDGDRMPCDVLAIAIGVSPRTELARNAGLNVDRGIIVDDRLRTSAPDIYAAGDVAQVYDSRVGRATLDTLWNVARDQGTTAGRNMAGGDYAYNKAVTLNVTRLAGITTTIIGAVGSGRDPDLVGISRGDSEAWRGLGNQANLGALVAEDHHEVNHLRLLIGPATIVGAVVMGDQAVSRPLQRLVAQSVDITPIRNRLLAPGAPLARIITEFANATQRS
jgi:NAD(P)H-nitrite reductase large subunit